MKFAARKHKPSALILEYLTSRAVRQQVSLPSFILFKSFTLKKKRSSEESANRLSKRFNKGSPRQLYHMELDPNGVDDQDEHQDDNWDDGHEPSGECESDWDTLAFELEKSFPHCTTLFCKERNIVHTHSTDRCYKLHPSKGKGGSSKGSSSSLFTKGGKVAAKERVRARARARKAWKGQGSPQG